jgi:hypothetical protein
MLFLCLHYAYVAYLYELQFFLWEIWLLLIDCPQFFWNKKCYNSAIIICILLFSLQIVVYILNCNLFFNHLCQWSTNSHTYTYMPILFPCQWSVTFLVWWNQFSIWLSSYLFVTDELIHQFVHVFLQHILQLSPITFNHIFTSIRLKTRI